MTPNNAQFSALEPSWATRYTEGQLRGLLVIAALFNEKLYIHDTQLADNVTLIHSFIRSADDDAALFNLLYDLLRADIVRVSLRNSIFVRNDQKDFPVSTLMDIHEIFKRRSAFGWVSEDKFEARATMLSKLDKLADEHTPFRYNYINLKTNFMSLVREYSQECGTEHYRLLSETPIDFRAPYDEILSRDWFSFIDIIDLCARFDIRLDAEIIQSHGLMDEICYSDWHRSRMLGINSKTWSPEIDVSPNHSRDVGKGQSPLLPVNQQRLSLSAIQEKMLATIETPGLTLIGTLTAQDILILRESAKDIFHFRSLELNDPDEVQRRFTDSLLAYWQTICAYIRKVRPHLTTDKTKLAIFVRNELPTLSKWTSRVTTFTFDAAFDLTYTALAKNTPSDAFRDKLRSLLSFRFLFYGESREMKQLRACLPSSSWLLSRNQKNAPLLLRQ